MNRRPRVRFYTPLLLALTLSAGGCGSADTPVSVTGRVTFKGEPVGEGTVQFIDEATGRGAEVPLKADGGYQAELFKGTYKVLISPPYLVDESKGVPQPTYKKVKNIPVKYQSTATSGLSATVGPDAAKHDFAMNP